MDPLLFNKKWYLLKLETPESYFAKKYQNNYDLVYGQKRINTGYEFNNDVTELLSSNVYENIISARGTSKYYRNFYTKGNSPVGGFMNDNITYELYKGSSELDVKSFDLYGVNFIDVSKTTEWYSIPGNDFMEKLCFYDEDNGTVDAMSTLVFFSGYITPQDVKGNPIRYYVTDDVPEMDKLNEGPCYINTLSEYNKMGERIAYIVTRFPVYSKYLIDNNNILASWDLGQPKEIFIDSIKYPAGFTVYDKYWSKFYEDQFDVNTRKLTCYVKLNDLKVSQDLLRNFYYFNNSIWVLNKIDSYDVLRDETTRCEFIKVQDIRNYIYEPNVGIYISLNKDEETIYSGGGSLQFIVNSSITWQVSYNSPGTSVYPLKGDPGETILEIGVAPSSESRSLLVTLSGGGITKDINIRQIII